MDVADNPYRPGAGRRPPVLAGRELEFGAFDVVRRRAEEYGEGERSWILSGRRGSARRFCSTSCGDDQSQLADIY
jgi:hypothetical protein